MEIITLGPNVNDIEACKNIPKLTAENPEIVANAVATATVAVAATAAVKIAAPLVKIAVDIAKWKRRSPYPVHIIRSKHGIGAMSLESKQLANGELRFQVHGLASYNPKTGDIINRFDAAASSMGVNSRQMVMLQDMARARGYSSFQYSYRPGNMRLHEINMRRYGPGWTEVGTQWAADLADCPATFQVFRIPVVSRAAGIPRGHALSTTRDVVTLVSKKGLSIPAGAGYIESRTNADIGRPLARTSMTLGPLNMDSWDAPLKSVSKFIHTAIVDIKRADSKSTADSKSERLTHKVLAHTAPLCTMAPPPPPPPTQPRELAARLDEAPIRQVGITTSIITQKTGEWNATPDNCYRRPNGQFMFICPDSGEHIPVSGTPPPAIAHIPVPPPPPPPPALPPPATFVHEGQTYTVGEVFERNGMKYRVTGIRESSMII